ncbi:adenylate/guanylate cyclase domain-containing protein [Rhizobium leguminosarum]|uniref:adenylate/guanylate cyclase domain-containing protein n=1 Tax=Rhizobium leguminosarum TaxID=384 RepID=UPI0013DD6F05|nr:hypothetical protein [Rhizobium leguminosarum]NEK33003.1 hypothetical protein [Rhizobium leguminosarum]
MFRSVSFAYPSAETATIGEWRQISEMDVARRLVRELYLRDPIKDVEFGFNAVAVYGFYKTPKGNKCVYFWHQDFKEISPANGGNVADLPGYLELGLALSEMADNFPSWSTAKQFHARDWAKQLGWLKGTNDYELHWKTFDTLSFVCLYVHPRETDKRTKHYPVTDVAKNDCLSFHYDYFYYRSPVWTAIPISYFFDRIGSSVKTLCTVHLEPKSFSPLEKPTGDPFLWPWQRCINLDGDQLSFRGLRSCSLVFDLRKSTLAMQSVKDIGKYSPFIESIVECAREAIFSNGGFFDKETGDGVVGHFVEVGKLDREPPEKRAFEAAVQMVRNATDLCEKFQCELDDWINNLGGAVGLHVGQAVWTATRNHVQAIGESVVTAARLCSEANVHSVFVSNGFFQILSKQIRPEVIAKFSRKAYLGKENGAVPQKSGFSIDVSDMIK